VSRKAIEAHYKAASGTFMGEVLSRAKAAIQIKPQDNQGTSIEAVLGRMGANLKAGNLKAVLKDAQALPADAESEVKPWLAQVAAREQAEEALRSSEQELTQLLTRPNSRRQ
jgi:hypothetical protein